MFQEDHRSVNLLRGTLSKFCSPYFRSPDHNLPRPVLLSDICSTWPKARMFRQQANTDHSAPQYTHHIQPLKAASSITQSHPLGKMRQLASRFEDFFMSVLKPYPSQFLLCVLSKLCSQILACCRSVFDCRDLPGRCVAYCVAI